MMRKKMYIVNEFSVLYGSGNNSNIILEGLGDGFRGYNTYFGVDTHTQLYHIK